MVEMLYVTSYLLVVVRRVGGQGGAQVATMAMCARERRRGATRLGLPAGVPSVLAVAHAAVEPLHPVALGLDCLGIQLLSPGLGLPLQRSNHPGIDEVTADATGVAVDVPRLDHHRVGRPTVTQGEVLAARDARRAVRACR